MPERSLRAVTLTLALSFFSQPAGGGLEPGARAWLEGGKGAVRGVTIGPIENALHPNKGYGTATCRESLRQVRRMGANWVSITPFGRVWDLSPSGVSMTFEMPFAKNRVNVMAAIEQAHAEGLRVMLVPHLWVETGQWRGEIDPGDARAWQRWAEGYRAFLIEWARVARDAGAEMFSVGVELRSWLTTTRAPSFIQIVREVRTLYPGLLTYAANWDDVEQTVILGEIDVIGINAFYPLAEKPGADFATLLEGGRSVAKRIELLARAWERPVVFTEFGYTTRKDPAVRPWEWPEHLSQVVVDELAQADAYRALLLPLVEQDYFAGFFMWRLFSDADDLSQEPLWGFSPRGKLAELVLRDAFEAHWAADGPRLLGGWLQADPVLEIGVF
jgi:hypothetical protein